MLAVLFAATSLMANVPAGAKKVKAKEANCISCPKGQKCTKATCPDEASCCK